MDNAVLYFLVGLAVCFIGTIPFGPINLTVVKTTVDYDPRRGMEFALAASLVEIAEALIAISFGMLISSYLENNIVFKATVAIFFLALSVFVFTRKSKPSLSQQHSSQPSFFRRGLIIAALNPQAIPFWIVALAAIGQNLNFEYTGIYLAVFLFGVFIGKLLALYGFVIASSYLKTHLQQSSELVNKLLAIILLLIGLTQLWSIAGLLAK